MARSLAKPYNEIVGKTATGGRRARTRLGPFERGGRTRCQGCRTMPSTRRYKAGASAFRHDRAEPGRDRQCGLECGLDRHRRGDDLSDRLSLPQPLPRDFGSPKDSNRPTPALRLNDGLDYVPTNRSVLFGHHFAAIAGAGPPSARFWRPRWAFGPGMLWILVGVVLAGAVQDFMILFISTRRDGRSLGEMVKTEMGEVAGSRSRCSARS